MANSEIIGAGQDTAHRAPKIKYPPILDVCCASRAFWFDKHDSRAMFVDKRTETIVREDTVRKDGTPWRGWTMEIAPDQDVDFRALPFPSETFCHVVFDPPHAKFGESSYMAKQYGTLRGEDWKDLLRRGFAECFRVLRPNGTLIFKWNEQDIPVRDILELTPEKPLYGHKSGRLNKTHWIAFMKGEESPVLGDESPAQNTMEICHTAPNSAMLQGLKPHAGGTGTSA